MSAILAMITTLAADARLAPGKIWSSIGGLFGLLVSGGTLFHQIVTALPDGSSYWSIALLLCGVLASILTGIASSYSIARHLDISNAKTDALANIILSAEHVEQRLAEFLGMQTTDFSGANKAGAPVAANLGLQTTDSSSANKT